MIVQIDINELAAEITRKIKDEINKIKVVDFGEVFSVEEISPGMWRASVLLAGAQMESIPFDCLGSYVPQPADWVLLVYPKNSAPVIVGKCPAL